jgi:hypothetical protein
MSLRTAAQQALEALKMIDNAMPFPVAKHAIKQLIAALAEPGNDYERGFVDGMSHQAQSSVDRAVNAMARKPLTNAEIGSIEMGLRKYVDGDRYDLSLSEFARAIERAHGIGGEA